MTCHFGKGIVICTPTKAVRRIVRLCGQCKSKQRGLFYDEGYYGARWLFLCGHSYHIDEGFWPRYQGPVHRKAITEEVRLGWKERMPSWETQQRRLRKAMGF